MDHPTALPRAARRLEPGGRFGVRALLFASALFLLAVPFGLVVFLVRESWGPLHTLDVDVADDLHGYAVRHDGFVDFFKAVSTVGSAASYWVLIIVLTLWLLYRRLPRVAVFTVVTVAGSTLLNNAVKAAVGRTRPLFEDAVATAPGKSFPSGHAQCAFVVAGTLLLVLAPAVRRPLRWWLLGVGVAWALLVGFARIGLGVHYVSDVVGGYLLGAAWLAATTAAFSMWRTERGRPPVRPSEGLAPETGDALTPGSP